jgi:hypothetical protein
MAVKALNEASIAPQTATSHELKVASSSEFRAAVIMESGVATPAELAALQADAGEAMVASCRQVQHGRPSRK